VAKQWTELEKMTVPKGATLSNAASLHPRTGTIAVVTAYSPKMTLPATLRVSADGELFVPFYHKGHVVKLESNAAVDIPLPACQAMRIELMTVEDEDKEFRVLALLEID